MPRYKSRRYTETKPTRPVDALRDAAIAASDRRNQLNYAWISDCGPGWELNYVNHYETLIRLVGEADKAWRAVAERDGVPYVACVDCGWLPRYTEALEAARTRAAKAAIPKQEPSTDTQDECQVSMQWLDQPDSETGGL